MTVVGGARYTGVEARVAGRASLADYTASTEHLDGGAAALIVILMDAPWEPDSPGSLLGCKPLIISSPR
jgi:hypothetical protein